MSAGHPQVDRRVLSGRFAFGVPLEFIRVERTQEDRDYALRVIRGEEPLKRHDPELTYWALSWGWHRFPTEAEVQGARRRWRWWLEYRPQGAPDYRDEWAREWRP